MGEDPLVFNSISIVLQEWGTFDSTQDRIGKAMVKILRKAVKDSEGSQEGVTHSYDAKL